MNEIRAKRRQRMFQAIQDIRCKNNECKNNRNEYSERIPEKINNVLNELSEEERSLKNEESDYYFSDFNQEYGKFYLKYRLILI